MSGVAIGTVVAGCASNTSVSASYRSRTAAQVVTTEPRSTPARPFRTRPPSHWRRISVPWKLVTASGRSLSIKAGGGGCDRVEGLGVREAADRVTIAVYYRVPTIGVCPSIAWVRSLRTTLSAPIGHRKVVHAPVTPGVTS